MGLEVDDTRETRERSTDPRTIKTPDLKANKKVEKKTIDIKADKKQQFSAAKKVPEKNPNPIVIPPASHLHRGDREVVLAQRQL